MSRTFTWLALLCVAAACRGAERPPHQPVIARELMITDLTVVNDARANGPNGPWSFGGLIAAMAGGTDPGRFALDWLRSWETDRIVNTFTVPGRPAIRSLIIEPWKARDGRPGVADDDWIPDLTHAPFRLLAIVNRIDLHGTANGRTHAGEGRFVFGVTDAAGAPLPFTVIFEYEQIAADDAAVRAWAQRWHALGTMPFGAVYNAALQEVTDRFAARDAAPAKPNGSALNQVRTNEIALVLPADVQRGWELREFHLEGGALTTAPASQAPDNSLQNAAALAAFVNDNEADILRRAFTIPPQVRGSPFLAGSSIVAPPAQGFFWRAPGIRNNEARHIVAFTACNGCHHVETGTTGFVHVANRDMTAEAQLSGFLTGIADVPDPVDSMVRRSFNDLAARAAILATLADQPVGGAARSAAADRRSRVH